MGYEATQTGKKRLVGISRGDHLDVTDLCWATNDEGKTAIEVSLEYGVPGANVVAGLAACGTMPDPIKGPQIAAYASTAALEETLHCKDRTAAFANLRNKFPEVGEFLESP